MILTVSGKRKAKLLQKYTNDLCVRVLHASCFLKLESFATRCEALLPCDRERCIIKAMADYSDGAELDELIKAIIDRTAKNEALESKFFDCKNEQIRVDRQNSDDQKEKIELLIELESSRSFASTHATVEKMRRVDTWTQEEREAIFEIALSNSQVRYIIGDLDVKMFYLGLLRNCQNLSEKAVEVKAMLEG